MQAQVACGCSRMFASWLLCHKAASATLGVRSSISSQLVLLLAAEVSHHSVCVRQHRVGSVSFSLDVARHLSTSARQTAWSVLHTLSDHSVVHLHCVAVQDLIQKTGYYWQNPYSYERISDEKFEFLKTDAGLHDAVGILNKAFDRWGIEDTLAFVRRGGDAFDPYSQYTKPDGTGSCWRNYWSAMHSAGFKPQSVYDEVVDYLSCIKKFLQYIDENEGYLTNKWRPDIHCPHLPLPGSATQ